MSEKPILFSGGMVRAILEGRKTVTRRVVKPQPEPSSLPNVIKWKGEESAPQSPFAPIYGRNRCPYGCVGDRLWVRETWADSLDESDRAELGQHVWHEVLNCEGNPISEPTIFYRVDDDDFDGDEVYWRSPIHMPKWASRITLEITDVRVERLQEISIEDCEAEGVIDWSAPDDEEAQFRMVWDRINGKKPGCSWQDSPWVWVVSFKRLDPQPVDKPIALPPEEKTPTVRARSEE